MRKITGNPYDEIKEIIRKWVEGPAGDYYDDFLVTIMLDGRPPQTEFLELNMDSDIKWCWMNDFWEGEKDVVLCGFAPIHRILIRGDPDGNELVEEGESKYSIRDRLIKEAIEAGYIKADGNG